MLPEEISCRIAAGEVVERPASVIKELIDNSLDAGSSLITIEVEEGGRRTIRVIDNGCGMNATDAQLACQRFATSKLRTEEDLHILTTRGFRGEALPSIASISRMHLRTLSTDASVGMETFSQGGEHWEVKEWAGSPGTQIEVRDLFFNTPGRLKFLKTVTTEFSKICYVVQQAAMVNPQVHFRLMHHQQKVLEYPAVPSTQDRLLQIYGSTFLERYLPIDHGASGLRITGFTVSPNHARTTRTPQEIFVNLRPIKNTTISHAIYEAYRSFLAKGKHPQFIVCIQLDPQAIDINVHPTKREVRFSHPEVIHAAVLRAIKQVFFGNSPFAVHPLQDNPNTEATTARPSSPPTPSTLGVTQVPPAGNSEPIRKSQPNYPANFSLFVQEPLEPYTTQEPTIEVTPLGQIHHTYILGQINEDLFVIDQHTAHERVLFERLLRAWNEQRLLQQQLLIPETIDLLPHQGALLQEWIPVFNHTGLEIEPFGPSSFVIRSVPALLGSVAMGPLILELLDELSEWRSTDALNGLIRPILATMACQSAVQAGRIMTQPEIATLLRDWASEKFPMTCPHGRRVAIRHTFEELHTLFSRTPQKA